MPTWLDGRLRRADRVAARTGCSTSARARFSTTRPAVLQRDERPVRLRPRRRRAGRWLAFLDDLWGDDADSIDAAAASGSATPISGRLDLHKILLLVGPTRAGKGVISRILGALVGDGERRRPDAVEPDRRFRSGAAARQDARHRLRRPPERPRRARRRRAAAVDLRRGLHHRQPQVPRPVDRQAAVPACCCSNELPQLGDASHGDRRPVRAARCCRSRWYGQEDLGLEDALAPSCRAS